MIKHMMFLLIVSFNLSAMQLCYENDEYHVSIKGLNKEKVVQAFFTFVELKEGRVQVPVTLNEYDFGPIRNNNWGIEYLKAYYLPLDLSGNVINVSAFNAYYIRYGSNIAQNIINALKEEICLK